MVRTFRDKPKSADLVDLARREVRFLGKMQTYISKSPRMSAHEAAREWLEIFDEGRTVPCWLPTNGLGGGWVGSMLSVFGALPRPASWPSLVSMLSRRPSTIETEGLLLLFARLRGDEVVVVRLCDRLEARWANQKLQSHPDLRLVRLASLRRRRDVTSELSLIASSIGGSSESYQISPLPDIASRMDPSQAESELLALLRRTKSPLELNGRATEELAKRLVLGNLDKIHFQPWTMARDLRDADLVASLVSYHGPSEEQFRSSGAAQIYLLLLLAHGSVDQAREFSDGLSFSPSLSVESSVLPVAVAQSVFDSLQKIQLSSPNERLWNLYIDAAKVSGNALAASKLCSVRLQNSTLDTSARWHLLRDQIGLYSCLGDSESVATALREIARSPLALHEFASAMIQFGSTLHLPEIEDFGISERLKAVDAAGDWELHDALMERKRFADAEALQKRYVERTFSDTRSHFQGDECAERLCDIYFRTNRPEKLVACLKEFPAWSTSNFGFLGLSGGTGAALNGKPSHLGLYYYAAWALAKTGDRRLAVRILHHALLSAERAPSVFRLLNELEGRSGLPFYRHLARLDPLDLRILVGKADLVRSLGRVREARVLAVRAIEQDPIDLRGYHGDRLSGFATLEKILGSSGDASGAAKCRKRLEAARHAGRGDELLPLGLLPQAAEAYGKSLELASSDFTVEERLARCLDLQGLQSQAATHHKRAFQKMCEEIGPTSTIPEEMELLFNDPNLEAIRKQAVVELSRKKNRGASTYYVIGRLEEAEGQPRAAVREQMEAVASDPRFILAWSKLNSLGVEGFLTQGQTEQALYKLIDVASLAEEDLPSLPAYEDIGDLGRAYEKIRAAMPRFTLPRSALLPLHTRRLGDDYDVQAPWMALERGVFTSVTQPLTFCRDLLKIFQVIDSTAAPRQIVVNN